MPNKVEQRKKYAHIPHKARIELIDLVQKENYPLSVASDLLKIKLSTAKLIMSKYKSNGYVTRLKNEKNSENQSHQNSQSKKETKNLTKSSHQQPKSSNPEVQKQNRSTQSVDQNPRNVENNQGKILSSGTYVGIIPWNGLMLPFIYVSNPQ